jgi:hypothetical protein
MFIVLIHWRIKPSETDVSNFRAKWRSMSINDDNNLIGEFLSEPLGAKEVPYPVDEIGPTEDLQYLSFVNVGIWKDEKSFFAEIGKYIPPPGGQLQDFEQYPRRRIPLTPQLWRRGKFELPELNQL